MSDPYMLLAHFADGPSERVPYRGQTGREHVRAECRKIIAGALGAPATSVEIMRPAMGDWMTVETIEAK